MLAALTASLSILAGAHLGAGASAVAVSAIAQPTPSVTGIATPRQSSNITVIGPGGMTLADDPVLQPGEKLTAIATGFVPGGTVLVGPAGWRPAHVTASSAGTIRYPFTVPAAFAGGAHVLDFEGTEAPPGHPSGTGTAGGDNQPIRASVPEIAVFPFFVTGTGGSTSPPPATASPTASGPISSTSGGTGQHLGFTGSDVLLVTLLGLASLAAGLFLLVTVRHRRTVDPERDSNILERPRTSSNDLEQRGK
jgi:hypothetical protein